MKRILSMVFIFLVIIETCLPVHVVRADEEAGETDDNTVLVEETIVEETIVEEPSTEPSDSQTTLENNYEITLNNGGKNRNYGGSYNVATTWEDEGLVFYGASNFPGFMQSVYQIVLRKSSNSSSSATVTSSDFRCLTDSGNNKYILVPWSVLDSLGFNPDSATLHGGSRQLSANISFRDNRANVPSDLQISMSEDGLTISTNDTDYISALYGDNDSVINETGTVNIYSDSSTKELWITNNSSNSYTPIQYYEGTSAFGVPIGELLNISNQGSLVDGSAYVKLCAYGYKPTSLRPVTVSGAEIRTPSSASITIVNGDIHISVGTLSEVEWLDEITYVEVLKDNVVKTFNVPERNDEETFIDIPLDNVAFNSNSYFENGDTYSILAYCGGHKDHDSDSYTRVSACNKAVSGVAVSGVFNTIVSIGSDSTYIKFTCENTTYLNEIVSVEIERTSGYTYRQTISSSSFTYSNDHKTLMIPKAEITTPDGNNSFTLVPPEESGHPSVTKTTSVSTGRSLLPTITFSQNSDYDLLLTSSGNGGITFNSALMSANGVPTDESDYGIILTNKEDSSEHACFYNREGETLIHVENGSLVIDAETIHSKGLSSGDYDVKIKVNTYAYCAEFDPIEVVVIEPVPSDVTIAMDADGNILINSPTDKNYLDQIYNSETARVVLSSGTDTYGFVNENDNLIAWSSDEKTLIISPVSQRKRSLVNGTYTITVSSLYYQVKTDTVTLTGAYTPLPSMLDITVTADSNGLTIAANGEEAETYLSEVTSISLRRTRADGLRVEDIDSRYFEYDDVNNNIVLTVNELDALKITNSIHDRITLSASDYLPLDFDFSNGYSFNTGYADMPVMSVSMVSGNLRIESQEANSSNYFTKICEVEIYVHSDDSNVIRFPASDITINSADSYLLIPDKYLAEAGYSNEKIDIRLYVTDSYENWNTTYQMGNAVSLKAAPIATATFSQPGRSRVIFEFSSNDLDWLQGLSDYFMKEEGDDFVGLGVHAENNTDSITVTNTYTKNNVGVITYSSPISCSTEDYTLTVDFSGLNVGNYSLTFHSPGYEDYTMTMNGFLADCMPVPTLSIVEGIFGDLEIIARDDSSYSSCVYQMDVYNGDTLLAEIPVSEYKENGNALFSNTDFGEAGLESNINYRFVLHANGNYIDYEGYKTLYYLVKLGSLPADIRIVQKSSGNIEITSSNTAYINGIVQIDDGSRTGVSFFNNNDDGALISNTTAYPNRITKTADNKVVISADTLKTSGVTNGHNNISIYSYGYRCKETTMTLSNACDYAPSGISIQVYSNGTELDHSSGNETGFSGIKIVGTTQQDSTYLQNVTGISIEKTDNDDLDSYFNRSSMSYNAKTKTMSLSKETMDNSGMVSEIYDEITIYSYGYVPVTAEGAYNINTSTSVSPAITISWDDEDNLVLTASKSGSTYRNYLDAIDYLKITQGNKSYYLYSNVLDIDIEEATITVSKDVFVESALQAAPFTITVTPERGFSSNTYEITDGSAHLTGLTRQQVNADEITLAQGTDGKLIVEGPEGWLENLTKQYLAKDGTNRRVGVSLVGQGMISNLVINSKGTVTAVVEDNIEYADGQAFIDLNGYSGDLSLTFSSLGYEAYSTTFENFRNGLSACPEIEFEHQGNRLYINSNEDYLKDINVIEIRDEDDNLIVEAVPVSAIVGTERRYFIEDSQLDLYEFDNEAEYSFTIISNSYLDYTEVIQIDWLTSIAAPGTLTVDQETDGNLLLAVTEENPSEAELAYIQAIDYVVVTLGTDQIELHDFYINDVGNEITFYSGALVEGHTGTLSCSVDVYAHGYTVKHASKLSGFNVSLITIAINNDGKNDGDLYGIQKGTYYVGDTFEVNSRYYPTSHYDIVSSDSRILKVENGTATFLKAGKVNVTIKEGTVQKRILKVTCVDFTLKLTAEKTKAVTGDTFALSVTDTHPDKDAVITSSDESIAVYDESTQQVVCIGSGTVTFTATINNKTSKVTIAVYPIDPSRKLTAGFYYTDTALGLMIGENEYFGDSIVITGTAKGKEEETYVADLFTYSSSNPSVVSVDEEGNLTGLKKGTATITATLKDDPAKRKATIKVKTIDPQVSYVSTEYTLLDSYKNAYSEESIPAEEMGLSYYVGFDYDKEIHEGDYILIDYTVVGFDEEEMNNTKLKWTSSDTSVVEIVTSGNTVYAKIKKAGTVQIQATAQDIYKSTTEIELVLDSYAPSISANEFTVNVASDDNIYFDYSLPYEDMELESIDFYIEDEENPGELIACNYLEEDEINLGIASLNHHFNLSDGNKTYNLIMRMTVSVEDEEGTREFDYSIKVNTIKEYAKVTIKPVSGSINCFDRSGSVQLNVDAENDYFGWLIDDVTVADSSAAYYDIVKNDGVYSLVSSTDAPDAKYPKEVTLDISYGYSYIGTSQVKVSVSKYLKTDKKNYQYSLSATTLTVNSKLPDKTVQFYLKNKAGSKITLETSDITVTSKNTKQALPFTISDSVVTVTLPSAKADTLTISYNHGFTTPLTYTAKVKVDTKTPAILLKSSTLNLSDFCETASTEVYGLYGSDFADVDVNPQETNAGLSVIYNNGILTAQITDRTFVSNKTYKFTITGSLNGVDLTAATLSVKVSNSSPKVTLPTLKLNTFNETSISANAVLSGVDSNASISNSGTLLDNTYVTVSIVNGVITATKKAAVSKTTTYSYSLTPVIAKEGKNDIALKKVTGKITLTATQPEYKLSSSKLTLNKKLAGYEVISVNTSITKANGLNMAIKEMAVDSIVAPKGGNKEDLNVVFEDGVLKFSVDGTVKAGTYKVTVHPVYEDENEQTYNGKSSVITVTVIDKNETATITIKNKLNVLTRDNGVSATVKLANATGDSISTVTLDTKNAEYLEVEEISANGFVLKLREDAEIKKDTTLSGTATIGTAYGKSISAKYSVKVTRIAPKITAKNNTVYVYDRYASISCSPSYKIVSPSGIGIDTSDIIGLDELSEETMGFFGTGLFYDNSSYGTLSFMATFYNGALLTKKTTTLKYRITQFEGDTYTKKLTADFTIKIVDETGKIIPSGWRYVEAAD